MIKLYHSKDISKLIDEANWSDDVKTKWHPAPGFFEKSASEIANGLKSNSSSLQQAMSRLSFFINRAGSNLSSERKAELESAKNILDKLYRKEA